MGRKLSTSRSGNRVDMDSADCNSPVASRGALFDDATAVERLTASRYIGRIQPEWFGGGGPSGGYLAAIILRVLMVALNEPQRYPRALNCQFLGATNFGSGPVASRGPEDRKAS